MSAFAAASLQRRWLFGARRTKHLSDGKMKLGVYGNFAVYAQFLGIYEIFLAVRPISLT